MTRQKNKTVDYGEVENLAEQAKIKLKKIIAREGDLNGLRLEPWYLAELLSEVILEHQVSKKYGRAVDGGKNWLRRGITSS